MGDAATGYTAASGTTIKRRKISRYSRASIRAAAMLPPPNTYRLTPKFPFDPKTVYKLLEQKVTPVFEKILEYDFDDMAVLCKFLSVDLLRATNALSWPSYKIVTVVQCVEKSDNTCRGSVRYFWNPLYDGLVNYKHETDYYIVVVTAAFFYFE